MNRSLPEDPYIHWMRVDRATAGVEEDDVIEVYVECRGGPRAPCRWYPDCDCETFYPDANGEHQHPYVWNDECIVVPWFQAQMTPIDIVEIFESRDDDPMEQEFGLGDLRNGFVRTRWHGDYLTWDYSPIPDMKDRESVERWLSA